MPFKGKEGYEKIINGMNDAIFVHDLEGNFIEVNQAAINRYGYTEEEFNEMSLHDLDSEKSKVHIEERLEEIEKRGALTFKVEHKTKKGNKIPVEINSSLIDFKGKKVVLSIARDITERMESKEKLKISEQRFRRSFEVSPDPMFLLDEEGVFKDLNRAAIEKLRYEKEELVGKHLSEAPFFSEETAERVAERFYKRRQGEDISPYEIEFITKDGEKLVTEINVGGFESDGFGGEIAIARDITERKKAEEKLRDLLEERENIINRLSHDLKTPLSPLVNLIPLIRENVEKRSDDKTLKKDLEICEKNVHYLKELLEHILKLAEYSQSGRKADLETIEIRELIEEWLSNFKQRRMDDIEDGKDIEFENEIDQDTAIEIDKMGLFEVFDNLAENSIEHISDEGKITFEIEESDGTVTIVVRDTGRGLDEKEMNKIFKYFYTKGKTTHRLESTGLGLPISKYIIENHDGDIWAESHGEGHGTVFYIELPKKQKELI